MGISPLIIPVVAWIVLAVYAFRNRRQNPPLFRWFVYGTFLAVSAIAAGLVTSGMGGR